MEVGKTVTNKFIRAELQNVRVCESERLRLQGPSCFRFRCVHMSLREKRWRMEKKIQKELEKVLKCFMSGSAGGVNLQR